MTGIQILIVEDDAIIAASTQALLKGYGYNSVSIALTYDEAYSYLNSNVPDVVLMDINIDEKEAALGIKLALEFKKKEIPVIFLTAHTDSEIQNLALNTSPYGYFTKPVSAQDLKNAIEIAYYRSNMERRLRESEEKYRALFNLVPVALTVTNKSGQVIERNEMAEKILGIHSKEQTNPPIDGENRKIIRPDGSLMPREEYASVRALKEGKIVRDVEMGIVKENGSVTWINVTAAPLPLSRYGVAIAYSDITEKKKIEKTYEFFSQRPWIATNEDFFKALMQFLAQELDAEVVRIDRISDDLSWVYPYMIYNNGKYINGISMPIEKTLFKEVIAQGYWECKDCIAQQTVDAQFCIECGVENFFSVRLDDADGTIIGFLSVGKNKYDSEVTYIYPILRIAAVQTAYEFQRKQHEIFERGSANILELIALDVDQQTIFFLIVQLIKDWNSEFLSDVRFLGEEGDLKIVATHELSKEFVDESRNIFFESSENIWSYVYRTGKPAFCDNIVSNYQWLNGAKIFEREGIRACWMFPIRSRKHEVVGIFSIYRKSPGSLRKSELQIMESVTHLAAIAIESNRSRARLNLMQQSIENSPSAIVITDRNGKIEYVNPRFTEISGYSFEEVRGKNPKILNAGIQPKKHYQQLWRTILQGKIWRGEFCNKKKNGEIYWEDASISPLFDIKGNIVKFIAIKNDITQQKLAQKQLELNYKRTEALLGLALRKEKGIDELSQYFLEKILSITHSTVGFVNLISEDGTKYIPVAYSKETMKGCSMDKVDHFDMPAVGWLSEIIHTHKPLMVNDYQNMESPFKKGIPEGHVHITRFLAVPIVENGKIVAIAGVANKPENYTDDDVDELRIMLEAFWHLCLRKRIEDNILHERTRLMALVESIPDEVYQKNTEGQYVLVNRKAVERHSLNSIDEMLGKTDFDFLPLEIAQKSCDYDRIVLKELKTVSYGISINDKNNIRWYDITKVPLLGKNGIVEGILEIRRDTTELNQVMESLKIAKEDAERANQAKSDFLAAISHELRTPLNAIIGFAEVLREMKFDEAAMRRYIEHIHTSGEHLLEIINDILDISKIESGKLELEKSIFDVEQMLKTIFHVIQTVANKKNLSVELEIAPHTGSLEADEIRIRQVVLNLLSNAIKFTPEGKKIGIRAWGEGDNVIIEVWDEGIGISVSDIERIFLPFEQVKGRRMPNVMGTGLGLAIVKRLVEMHGGVVSVQSQIDKGSVFTITIPGRKIAVTAFEGMDSNEKAAGKVDFNFNSTSVLVVDDNEVNLELMKIILVKSGCTVDTTTSGEEAINKVMLNNFDAIFMDIQLSGMDGIETTRKIREISERYIPIIALTAFAMMGDKEKFLASGFDDYIEKPIKVEKVYEVLQKHLTKKSANVPLNR